jgi:hypothetical protein
LQVTMFSTKIRILLTQLQRRNTHIRQEYTPVLCVFNLLSGQTLLIVWIVVLGSKKTCHILV